ncbi:MAG: hypothetical protein ACOC33_03510 [bacterium]
MPYDENHIIKSNSVYKKIGSDVAPTRTIYYGEVMSTDDPTDGGRIKVKILGLDNKITETNNLPDCYPLMPKFFHVFPKVGEIVRIFIEDVKYPQRSRFWLGSIISQPQKIEFDSIYTALSTTNMALTRPEEAPSKNPNADGVFPEKDDVAIIGRNNTDFIQRDKQLELRVGKHEVNNILELNTRNPASIKLSFDNIKKDDYYSNTIITSDKIALISHSGNPQFKAVRVDSEERERIFNEGHPLARADVLVQALNIMRNAILNHIHGYSGVPADKNSIIKDLEAIDFEAMVQENIVIN